MMPADAAYVATTPSPILPINRRRIGNDKSIRIDVGPHNGAIQGCSHWTLITSLDLRKLSKRFADLTGEPCGERRLLENVLKRTLGLDIRPNCPPRYSILTHELAPLVR